MIPMVLTQLCLIVIFVMLHIIIRRQRILNERMDMVRECLGTLIDDYSDRHGDGE